MQKLLLFDFSISLSLLEEHFYLCLFSQRYLRIKIYGLDQFPCYDCCFKPR